MIEIKDLSFGYKKKQRIINNINLELKEGYIHGLLGKNAAGKTTLLKLISGLLFEDNGSILIDSYTPKKRQVGFLYNLFFLLEEFDVPKISIEKYVELYSVFYPNFSTEDFFANLTEFEIKDFKQNLRNLSYGTRKKVMIAFGLATGAKIMIFDEPTNGLDIPSKAQFRKIMLRAMKEDTTMIISTHQVRDLHNLIDSVVILEQGDILLNATNEEIISKLYFGCSYDIEMRQYSLYSEENINGMTYVKENFENKESNIDMEFLFAAVMLNKEKIKKIFENK